MNKAYLLTGGNIGDRLQTLTSAREFIDQQCGIITKASSVYETEAWGLTNQEKFLNQALEVQTPLSPPELLACILAIEQSMGRKRELKYGPRIIDIDILLFNDAIVDTQDLKIPHPQLQNRRFALVCLEEIGGTKIHPVLKQSISDLLASCPDSLKVYKF